MNEINSFGKGLGLIAVTGVTLVFLKALHVIEWSWIWVLIPFWGPVALIFLALLLIVILKAFAKFLGWVVKKI